MNDSNIFFSLRNFQDDSNCYFSAPVALFLRKYNISICFLSMSRRGKGTRRSDIYTYTTDVQNVISLTICSLLFIMASLDISELGPTMFKHLNHITEEGGIFVFQKHLHTTYDINFLFQNGEHLCAIFA